MLRTRRVFRVLLATIYVGAISALFIAAVGWMLFTVFENDADYVHSLVSVSFITSILLFALAIILQLISDRVDWMLFRRRLSGGRCPHCGYDLRGQTEPLRRCPECGG